MWELRLLKILAMGASVLSPIALLSIPWLLSVLQVRLRPFAVKVAASQLCPVSAGWIALGLQGCLNGLSIIVIIIIITTTLKMSKKPRALI